MEPELDADDQDYFDHLDRLQAEAWDEANAERAALLAAWEASDATFCLPDDEFPF